MSDKNSEPARLPPTPEDFAKWERVRQRLRAEVGDAVYESWFTRIDLDRVDASEVVLTVPTKFLKSWVQSHYFDRIRTHVVAEFGPIEALKIELRTQGRKSKPREPAPGPSEARSGFAPASSAAKGARAPTQGATRSDSAKAARAENDGFVGSPLDPRLTFESFLVGRSNQLAHAAACHASARRAEDGAPLFNPLYVHAAVGLGKTHLLQAMTQDARINGQRVVYLTAERFMSGFVSSIHANRSNAFKEELRGIDMLVIDDVQFLKGPVIQQEFCHTLNALMDAGRQVVVAAALPPAMLENLDERVLSRFKGGLCVELDALDESLRVKIVEARVVVAREKQAGFSLSSEVIAYVAQTMTTNGREIEGAVNRLLAHWALNGASLTVSMAEAAIRDLVRTQDPKKVKIDDIQKVVANHFNVSRADILSQRRTANVVRPRQIAMYLAKNLTLRSLPEIGRRFGGRDHTTVLHAVRKIEGLVSKDHNLAEEIELLKRMISDQ
ncbi:MAG: chromosomal replication initiator protein DnaA [Methylocystis sp.]